MSSANIETQSQIALTSYRTRLDPLVHAALLAAEYRAHSKDRRAKEDGVIPADSNRLASEQNRTLTSFAEELKALSKIAPRAVAEFLYDEFNVENSDSRKLAPIEHHRRSADPVLTFAKEFYANNRELIKSVENSPYAVVRANLLENAEHVQSVLSEIRGAITATKDNKPKSIIYEVRQLRDLILSDMPGPKNFDVRNFWRVLSGVSQEFNLPGPNHSGWKGHEEEQRIVSALLSGTPVSRELLDAQLAYVYLRDSKQKRDGVLNISLEETIFPSTAKYSESSATKNEIASRRAFQVEFKSRFAPKLGVDDFEDGVARILTAPQIASFAQDKLPFFESSSRFREICRQAREQSKIGDYFEEAKSLQQAIEQAEKGEMGRLIDAMLYNFIPRKIPYSYKQILIAFRELTGTDFLERLIPICKQLLTDSAVGQRYKDLVEERKQGSKPHRKSSQQYFLNEDQAQEKAEVLFGLSEQGLLVRNFTVPLGEAVRKKYSALENDREFKNMLRAYLRSRELFDRLNYTTDEADLYAIVSKAVSGLSRSELAQVETMLSFQPLLERQNKQETLQERTINGEIDYSYIPRSIKDFVARKKEFNFPENLHYIDTLVEKKISAPAADAEKLFLLLCLLEDLTHPERGVRTRTSSSREAGLHVLAELVGTTNTRHRSDMLQEFNKTWLPKLAARATLTAPTKGFPFSQPPAPLPNTLGGWLDRTLTLSDKIYRAWAYYKIRDFRQMTQ